MSGRLTIDDGRRTALFLAIAMMVGLAVARLPLAATAGVVALAAAVLLALINPLFGLALALLVGPLGALENVVRSGALLDSGQAALLLALASWLGGGLARRRLRVPATPFNGPWLLFVAVAALSLLDARSIPLGLVELLKWLEMGLIVWLILDLADDPTRRPAGRPAVLRLVLATLLLAGLVQALIGIWQFGLRGDGPEHFLVLGRFYRAYGTFEQPNPFGGYMNLTVFLGAGTALGYAAHLAGVKRKRNTESGVLTGHRGGTQSSTEEEASLASRWDSVSYPWNSVFLLWLLFALVCAGVGALGLVFSWSRGAWLGFLAGGAVLLLFSARRLAVGVAVAGTAALVLGGGLLLGVSVGFGPALSVAGRLSGFGDEFRLGDVRGVDINDANYAVLERLAHWQAATEMARDDLWSGVGFGNYTAAYPDYALINWPDALGHAHNYYLNLLAEVGAPGLLAYTLFWLFIVGQTVWLARRLAWPARGVAVGLLAAWAALAVHHLVDKLYVNNIYIHLGGMLGLLQLLVWRGFYSVDALRECQKWAC